MKLSDRPNTFKDGKIQKNVYILKTIGVSFVNKKNVNGQKPKNIENPKSLKTIGCLFRGLSKSNSALLGDTHYILKVFVQKMET